MFEAFPTAGKNQHWSWRPGSWEFRPRHGEEASEGSTGVRRHKLLDPSWAMLGIHGSRAKRSLGGCLDRELQNSWCLSNPLPRLTVGVCWRSEGRPPHLPSDPAAAHIWSVNQALSTAAWHCKFILVLSLDFRMGLVYKCFMVKGVWGSH